jgi:hypothetical protein
VLHEYPVPGGDVLATELERITAAAHEFAEIRLLNALRASGVKVRPTEAEEMERLMGVEGTALHVRLGLTSESDGSEGARAAECHRPMATPGREPHVVTGGSRRRPRRHPNVRRFAGLARLSRAAPGDGGSVT